MRSIVVSIIALIALAGILPAGVVSDVKVSGGYLFVASTDRTEIYDLTVDPMEKVSEILYPESTIPIDVIVGRNNLFIYHYQNEDDNGLYYYGLLRVQAPELKDDITANGAIPGGYLGYPTEECQYRKPHCFLDGDRLYCSYSKIVEEGSKYIHYYNLEDNQLYPLNYCLAYPLCDWSSCMLRTLGGTFFNKDESHFYAYEGTSDDGIGGVGSILIKEMADDPVCFQPVGNGYMQEEATGGPLRFLDGLGVVRGYNVDPENPWTITYSGIVFKDLSILEYSSQFMSDYTCTYANKHGGQDSGITRENSKYDVQDILVKEREIYLSSYISKSIPHVDYDEMDFGHDYINCEPYWEFYDLPTHPYGMAAANGTLYVAAEDKVYEFPLVHPDPDLPRGEILHAANDGSTLTLSGWAKDPEGIRNVFIRLDNAYQLIAEKDQGKGHIRPMDLRYDWRLSISLDAIDPGDYDVKVIAEDKDGDFSVIGTYSAKSASSRIMKRQMDRPDHPLVPVEPGRARNSADPSFRCVRRGGWRRE